MSDRTELDLNRTTNTAIPVDLTNIMARRNSGNLSCVAHQAGGQLLAKAEVPLDIRLREEYRLIV